MQTCGFQGRRWRCAACHPLQVFTLKLLQRQPSYSYTLPAEMFRLIFKENSFQFNGKHYLQTHGTAMGTKTAVSFANIFMAHIETTILSRTVFKATVWKRYIDDIFFLWDISKRDIEAFIEQANLHHPTVKFTAQICDTETTWDYFLDTVVYKGTRFEEKSILDVKDAF